jgi:hypothetical protein
MARSHGPPNGSDQPPLNGHKARQVAIALFIATTFGIMAILSFPVFRVRVPLRLPHPLEAALSPFERGIRRLAPVLGKPFRPGSPRTSVATGRERPRGVLQQGPSGTSRPGGPVSGPKPPPPEGGQPPGTGPTTTRALPTTLLRKLATTLSHRTTRLSADEARNIRALLAKLRSRPGACLADKACAKQLKRVEKLLRKLSPNKNADHKARHRHRHPKHPGSSSQEEGTSGDENHERNGSRGKDKHGKHKKHRGQVRHGEDGTHKKHR